MKRLRQKLLRLLRGRDKGTVAITFALSFPILLLLFGVIVQYALVATARLTVNRAADAASRSAMTAMPTDPLLEPGGPVMVRRAALLTLAGLSPISQEGATAESQQVMQAITDTGMTPPDRFDLRYTHADAATTVTVTPPPEPGQWQDWTELSRWHAPQADITVTYKFLLTVPGAKFIGVQETVSGVSGYYLTFTATRRVQLSDGREANSSANAYFEGQP